MLSQNLGSLHDFDDLGESFRIGDGGMRPHAHYIGNRDLRLFACSRLRGLSIQAVPAHGHDRMLITSGSETSGYSHALAYIASLRLATPAHMAIALILQMQKSPAV